MQTGREAEERADALRLKIEKLKRLAAGTTGPESVSASSMAEKLEAELKKTEEAARKTSSDPKTKKPRKPAAARPPRQARPANPEQEEMHGFDSDPVVMGEVLTGITHRYFQLAEHAARWSGVLLHVDRKWFAPYGIFYGQRDRITKAWSKFARLRKTFDKKLDKWVSEQPYRPSETERDGYARGFLEGAEKHEVDRETPIARRERESALRRCDLSYRMELGIK